MGRRPATQPRGRHGRLAQLLPALSGVEDARADGLIRQCGGEQGEHRVELTERGRAALRRAAVPPRSGRVQIAANGSGP